MVNFGPLAAEIVSLVWGTPANFNGFCVLASLLQRRRSTEVNQTLHLFGRLLDWYAIYTLSGSLAPWRSFATCKIHFRTIAQVSRAISSQLRHLSTIGKKLTKQQYVLQMTQQYGELRPTSGWDRSGILGHPYKFQLVSLLGSVTAHHVVVGVSRTLRRWTEGATYIRQGGHHLGHRPTF